MKNLLLTLEQRFQTDESFQRLLQNYTRALKEEHWQFLLYVIESVKAEMREDLLSQRFTKLEAVEKDVQQRAYYNIRQVLDFLSNPQAWLTQKKWKRDRLTKLFNRPKSEKAAESS